MGKSRILVLQLKEIIYTAIFLLFGILLVLVIVIMFKSNDTKETMSTSEAIYNPGIYTSEFSLNGTVISMEITVDECTVKDIKLVDTDDSIKKAYPLMESSLKDITKQLKSGTSIEDISISNDTRYTQELLINAINSALNSASSSAEPSSLPS